jgi:hypothetical protein
MRNVLVVAVLAAGLAGCYHATIETGRAANGVVVRNAWAHSFVAGLVPPSVISTASQCPNGVARVETQHSIANMVAQFLTFSLYSPMEIIVACAGPGAALTPENTITVSDESNAIREAAFDEAVTRAVAADAAVFVQF